MHSDNTVATPKTKPKINVVISRFIKKIPLYTKVCFIVFFASLAVHIVSFISPAFSDFFTRYIASLFRTVLATLTGWIPFSIAETVLLLIPVLLVIYFALTHNYFIKRDKPISLLIYGVISALMIMYSIAVMTFLTGYSNSTLDKKLGLDAEPVTSQDLHQTATTVYGELEKLQEQIEFSSDGFSKMPYDISEMSDKLLISYKECSKKYTFLHNIQAKIKPVALSEAMSYTHITGVYTFFTGEANIDAAFPDFTIPYTAAHEFAHQRGIARENEANFVAFLICINSDDPYIQYSGYINMLQYLSNALAKADRETYTAFYKSMNSKTQGEFKAYSAFFSKYRNSAASKVSGAVNDTYLKLQGTEGAVSYGMVVDLAVAYYSKNSQ